MREIWLFAIVLISLCLVDCSSKTDDVDEYLAEIIVNEHKYKFGSRSESGEEHEHTTFDKYGKILDRTTNYYNYILGYRNTLKYVYEYDNKNRVSQMSLYERLSLKHIIKYEYNEFDSVSIMKQYDKNGTLKEEWLYEYDESKHLSKMTEKVLWMSPDYGYERIYYYDNNTVTEVTTHLRDGSPFGTKVWEYDEHGNMLKETWTNDETGESTVQKLYSYEYNVTGQMTKKTKFDTTFPDRITYCDYSYNSDGTLDLIHISYSFKTDESDLIYTYVYVTG